MWYKSFEELLPNGDYEIIPPITIFEKLISEMVTAGGSPLETSFK